MFKKRSIKGQKRVFNRESSDSGSSDEEGGNIVKKQRPISTKPGISITNAPQDSIQSTEEITLSRNTEATKQDILRQEVADLDRQRKVSESSKNDGDDTDDSIYKGQSNYTKFIKPKARVEMDIKGPKKTAANVRSTTTFDFQRDVCKDYKQTGFCGYGDSCKFLHARDDFKAGWKLNKDWDLESNSRQHELEKVLKDIPFKCVLCKNDYKTPIKTMCGHYFCESCFLNRSKKNPNCIVCGKNTHGSALPAKNLKELLRKNTIVPQVPK